MNAVLAESRGKSVPLMLFLTLIFSWFITLILAFCKKEKDVPATKYLKKALLFSLVLGIFISVCFIAYKLGEVSEDLSLGTNSARSKFDVEGFDEIGPMIEVNGLIINILDKNGTYYLKAAITLELENERTVTEVNERMPQVRDSIMRLTGEKTYYELNSQEGKLKLREELLERLNKLLRAGKVTGVYFTEFFVQ
jgi:flagellar FliL protein